MQQDAFEILKTAQAMKVGKGGGTIEYQLGRPRSGGDLHIRVTKNVGGGGYFGKGWIRARNLEAAIRDAVDDGGGCFSSRALADGIASRCRNDPPFLAAVLLAEELTVRCEPQPHKFRPSEISFREWEELVANGSASEGPDQEQSPTEEAGVTATTHGPDATREVPEVSPEGRTEGLGGQGAAAAPGSNGPKPARRRGRRRAAAQTGEAP